MIDLQAIKESINPSSIDEEIDRMLEESPEPDFDPVAAGTEGWRTTTSDFLKHSLKLDGEDRGGR